MKSWVKLEKPDKHGNTHQCIDGPFCWMYGRVMFDMFIPYSGYGSRIIDMIKDWEN